MHVDGYFKSVHSPIQAGGIQNLHAERRIPVTIGRSAVVAALVVARIGSGQRAGTGQCECLAGCDAGSLSLASRSRASKKTEARSL
jgi:hypothetical protein